MPPPARNAAPVRGAALARIAFLAALAVPAGCSERAGPSPASALATSSPAAPPAASPAAPPPPSAALEAGDAGDAGDADDADDAPEPDAGGDAGAPDAPEAPFQADNKILPPRESEDLDARARGLFEAVAKNEPELGEPFWFPKEPFIPLKDIKNPGKYWDELHRLFVADVLELHRKRKSWEGARFLRFEQGSTPKWVPPGDEANKIGYYRSFRGKVFYEQGGKTHHFDVHTIISWQGRWYITHLGKIRR